MNLDATGKTILDVVGSAEHDHTGCDVGFVDQADGGQRPRRPPTLLGRFADHQSTAGAQQRSATFDRLGRRTEPTGDDGVEPEPSPVLVADLFGPPAPHVDPVGDSKLPGGPHQKRATLLDRVEQDRRERRSFDEDRQRRQTTTGAQVEQMHTPRVVSHLVEWGQEAVGVLDVIVDGARSEESEAFRLGENLDQYPAQCRTYSSSSVPDPFEDTGMTMTLRRGSVPTERVSTRPSSTRAS